MQQCPFRAFIKAAERTIVSNSPERFLRVRGDHILTKLVRPARGWVMQIKADVEKWPLLEWARLACAGLRTWTEKETEVEGVVKRPGGRVDGRRETTRLTARARDDGPMWTARPARMNRDKVTCSAYLRGLPARLDSTHLIPLSSPPCRTTGHWSV